ncbi:hypothetical protein [Aliidiomarina indica]|uniref:hypothetical protein n=1 Tax=Aliidiomarina indica TaxID=2749147 RepID=UPI00188FAD8C|nr:hypothetical protein [Aliidiomarina indica]
MRILLILCISLVVLGGCAKQPSRFTEIQDTSPTVNFKVQQPAGLELWVDGLAYGALEQYVYPNKALSLLPGQHLIEIRHGGRVVFSEQVYFSQGTYRTIEVRP